MAKWPIHFISGKKFPKRPNLADFAFLKAKWQPWYGLCQLTHVWWLSINNVRSFPDFLPVTYMTTHKKRTSQAITTTIPFLFRVLTVSVILQKLLEIAHIIGGKDVDIEYGNIDGRKR